MQLTVVTPPEVEPVSIAEFFADRRVTEPTADERAAAARVIAAARGHVEQYTRRALITQRLRVETAGRWVAAPVRLLRLPVASIALVEVDGVEMGASDYEAHLTHGQLWPAVGGVNSYPTQWLTASSYARRVVVEYVAGYGPAPEDVPEPLRQAVLRVAGDLWEHREDTITGTNVGEVSVTAAALMNPFKVFLA